MIKITNIFVLLHIFICIETMCYAQQGNLIDWKEWKADSTGSIGYRREVANIVEERISGVGFENVLIDMGVPNQIVHHDTCDMTFLYCIEGAGKDLGCEKSYVAVKFQSGVAAFAVVVWKGG